jgi:hypothetical protein
MRAYLASGLADGACDQQKKGRRISSPARLFAGGTSYKRRMPLKFELLTDAAAQASPAQQRSELIAC